MLGRTWKTLGEFDPRRLSAAANGAKRIEPCFAAMAAPA